MTLPDFIIEKDFCEISLYERKKTLIRITVNKNYFDRKKFEKGNINFSSCWNTFSGYKETAKMMHKTICSYIERMDKKYKRDDFKKIDFKKLTIEHNDAIDCW